MASKSVTYKNFKRLFDAAVAKDKIVAKHKSFNPDAYATEIELKKALVALGNKIAGELQSAGVAPDQVSQEVSDLMVFFNSIKVEPEIFDCKPPLEPGDITFDQIAGLSDVKDQLSINYIEPFMYPRLFPDVAKGILFYGPPGTGKSLLARASTAEITNAAFFAPTPGEIKGKYVGETEKNIDTIFKCAGQLVADPSSGYEFAIIFFDEFDSIGGKRGDDPNMSNSVNALLQAMDGIKRLKGVSVIAATNYPSSLDDAILRRFTTRIFVDLPDQEAREYLVREPLAMAYSNPDATPETKRASIRTSKGDFDDSAQYLRNIRTYGGFTSESAAGYFGGKTVVDKYIDPSYIQSLVETFGPTPVGRKIIDEVRSGADVKEDDSRLDTPVHIFGYSPSDITKIMEMAIRFASARALQGTAKKTKVDGAVKQYWVHTIDGKGTAIQQLSSVDAKLVINFDIRQSDVSRAMQNLSSTVDNRRYLELLKYAKHG